MPQWVSGVRLRHFSTTCAVQIEDCEGWWLSGCCGSVAEHWLHKPGVLGSISGDCKPFHFPLFCLDHVNCPYTITNYLHKKSAAFLPSIGTVEQFVKQVVSPHTFSAVIATLYTVLGFSGTVRVVLVP